VQSGKSGFFDIKSMRATKRNNYFRNHATSNNIGSPIKFPVWGPIKKLIIAEMGCPALGIWVGFLKQPALPGKAPPKKNSSKKIQKNKNH
jgi:hypothetical protein